MGISKKHTAKALSSQKPRLKAHFAKTSKPSNSIPIPTSAPPAAPVVQTHKQHAKWPALFKKHIGVLESHLKMLERVKQSLSGEEERDAVGRQEEWVQICDMVERARGTLGMAREAGRVFLEERYQRGMKNLRDKEKERKASRREADGKKNVNMEPLGTNENLGNTKADSRSEMDEEGTADEEGDAVFAPLNIGKKGPEISGVGRKDDSTEEEEEVSTAKGNEADANDLEPNPYFVIDTEPTPVVLNGDGLVVGQKKKKAKAKEDDGDGERVNKAKKSTSAISDIENVDFIAVEAQLKAEVDAALKAKEERDKAAESKESKDEKKKRKRRESRENVEKEVKKSKKDKKKRKAEDIGDGEDTSKSKKKQKKQNAEE